MAVELITPELRQPSLRPDNGPALIGVHVTDIEPIERAVEVLGIETADQRFFTDTPDDLVLLDTDIALSIPVINRQLYEGAVANNVHFIDAFKHSIGGIVLVAIACKAPSYSANVKKPHLKRDQALAASGLAGLALAFVQDSVGVPMVPTAVQTGLLAAGSVISAVSGVALQQTHQKNRIKAHTATILKANADLIHELDRVVLPTFY